MSHSQTPRWGGVLGAHVKRHGRPPQPYVFLGIKAAGCNRKCERRTRTQTFVEVRQRGVVVHERLTERIMKGKGGVGHQERNRKTSSSQ